MTDLSAKVFRTYNASITLQQQLEKLTKPNDTVHEKMLAYNRANRHVAILCNHQKSVPKTFGKTMSGLQEKIESKRKMVAEAKAAYKSAKGGEEGLARAKKKALKRCKQQLQVLEMQVADKDENKSIALNTSKLNYLDPRISVAWCRKFDVPIEKVYNKALRDKFQWAIDMTDEDFVF